MLKQLQTRLRIFLVVIFMAVVSLILGFSFWNTWQASQMADVSYIQRMASLIIYQLEADASAPEALLSNYEREMNVYTILKDNTGQVLYQSSPDTRTDFGTLGKIAQESIDMVSAGDHADLPKITDQGGYGEIEGNSHDRYYVIPAVISTKTGQWYSLVLFYEQTSIRNLLLRQLPAYGSIWLLAFGCILLVSRFLLRRAFEPTERVLKGQKDFVAAASHELKSPLAVIMANAEAMETIGGQEPRILASSDADKWTVHRQKINIDTLLITLFEAYEPICKGKSIQLKLALEETEYPLLDTDQERLFQILSIFLDNAVSYSPENSSIEIQTRQTAKELTFLVADHGKGIAKADRPFIFDRFYRADKSHTDKSHFGLGLSIAEELAKMLAGKIGFEDTPGGGATFFLTLPLK